MSSVARFRHSVALSRLGALLLLAVPAVAQTASPPAAKSAQQPNALIDPVWFKVMGNFGGWWNALSEEAKGNYIDGYTTAMGRANSVASGMCKTILSEAQPGGAKEALDLCFIASAFSFKLDKPLKPALDEFYKEPLNMRIPPELAMEHVRDELAGTKTAGQLLDELNDWRKIVNKDAAPNKR